MVKMDEGIYTNKVIDRIKSVLDSDLSAYEIAKQVGYSSANQVHNFRSGKSDYTAMKLSTAIEFEKLYNKIEGEVKMHKKIMEVVKKVQDFEIELNPEYDYYQEEYVDGLGDPYIVHYVENLGSLPGFEEGETLELFFEEHEEVKKMKEEEKQEFIAEMNEIADQFDYDKVVAYRFINDDIQWLK